MTTAKLSRGKALYLKAKAAYYNGKPVMDDARFDKLEDAIRKADPNWKELKKTGIRVKAKKQEVELPQFMPSLAKAYPEQLPKWLAKHGDNQLAMDKLDGSALFLRFIKGKPKALITRGDGVRGGDISFLIPHLNIPDLKSPVSVDMRCEAVIPRKVFEKKWASEFENARNATNGLLNRALENGKPHPAVKDIHIVVLGVYGRPLERGLRVAQLHGLHVVPHAVIKASEIETYEKRFALRRAHAIYDMDGLVLMPPWSVFGYANANKPKNVIAFKMNDEAGADTIEVQRIIWQVTSHGRIIPKIYIKPTRMDGVTVKHATVHNAKWMRDRSIGPGAKVKVLRSGGVIPKIVGVVKPGEFQEPDIAYTQKGVHFVVAKAAKATTDRMDVLKIKKFMKVLGIENAADGVITQCLAKLPTIRAWITAWHDGSLVKKMKVAGVGVNSLKIDEEFTRVLGRHVPAIKMMVAMHVFDPGVGERKLQIIQDSGMSMAQLLTAGIDQIEEIKGFSTKTAELVIAGLQDYKKTQQWLDSIVDVDYKLPKAKAKVKGKLSGQRVSFTSYRDKAHEAAIVSAGGEIVPFGSKTTILLYKEGGKLSGKIDKAKDKGLKVTTFNKLGV